MNACYAGRDHARAIIAAFTARLGPVSELVVKTRPWASATFTGERHTLSFVVDQPVELAEFLSELSELDLPLCRAFVADLVVAPPVDLGKGRVGLTVEALIIYEA